MPSQPVSAPQWARPQASRRSRASRVRRVALHRGGAVPGSGCRVLRRHDGAEIRLEPRHPHGRMDARQRRPRPDQHRRELVLLAERAGQRRSGAAVAARAGGNRLGWLRRRPHPRHRATGPSLPPAAGPAGHPPRAARRGRVARDLRRRRLPSTRPDHELPTRPVLPADRRGAGVDRPHAYLGDAVSGARRARGDDAGARTDGGSARHARRAGGDIQQRVQARRLGRRIRVRWPHVRADARRRGDDRALPQRPGRHRRLGRRSVGRAGRSCMRGRTCR